MKAGAFKLSLLAAMAALACLAAALTAQHRFDMQPCAWCVLQRLIYIALAVLAFAGALFVGTARRIALWLALLSGIAGMAAALWQEGYASQQQSCTVTLADRIIQLSHLDRLAPEVFVAYASCADAAVEIAGISFAWWSAAMFALLSVLIFFALRAQSKAAART